MALLQLASVWWCLIGLGADPGFTNSATNVITFATGGNERPCR